MEPFVWFFIGGIFGTVCGVVLGGAACEWKRGRG